MPVALKTPLTSEPTGLMIIVTAYAANKFFSIQLQKMLYFAMFFPCRRTSIDPNYVGYTTRSKDIGVRDFLLA